MMKLFPFLFLAWVFCQALFQVDEEKYQNTTGRIAIVAYATLTLWAMIEVLR